MLNVKDLELLVKAMYRNQLEPFCLSAHLLRFDQIM